MGAVRMLGRSELRRRWRSAIVLTLLVGFVGAVVLALVAGARRTDTSLERFEQSSRAGTVEVDVGDASAAEIDRFRRSPGVAAAAQLYQFTMVSPGDAFLSVAAEVDDRMGRTVDRARIVEGRTANLRRADEVTIGEQLARELHLRVGDRLRFASYSPADIDALRVDNSQLVPPHGPRVSFRVVGIVRRPLDLGGRGAAGGVVVLTPAFYERYRDRIGTFAGSLLRVRTRAGFGSAACHRHRQATLRRRRRVLLREPRHRGPRCAECDRRGDRGAVPRGRGRRADGARGRRHLALARSRAARRRTAHVERPRCAPAGTDAGGIDDRHPGGGGRRDPRVRGRVSRFAAVPDRRRRAGRAGARPPHGRIRARSRCSGRAPCSPRDHGGGGGARRVALAVARAGPPRRRGTHGGGRRRAANPRRGHPVRARSGPIPTRAARAVVARRVDVRDRGGRGGARALGEPRPPCVDAERVRLDMGRHRRRHRGSGEG